MDKYYAILEMTSEVPPTTDYQIFTGRTQLAAINRATIDLLENSVDSRAEYEEEHGKVDDEEWLKLMEEAGFTIAPAKLGDGCDDA